MSVALIREYWTYHHWANRKLFEVTAALGDDAAGRPVGKQFSEPTLRAMLVHIYGADRFWLETWRGPPPPGRPGRPPHWARPRTPAAAPGRRGAAQGEEPRLPH